MFLILLGGLLPAIFLVGIGQAFRSTEDEPDRYQDWAGFLAVSWGLLIAATLIASRAAGGVSAWLALLLLPSMCALLAEGVLFLTENAKAVFRRQVLAQLRWPAVILVIDLLLLAALQARERDALHAQAVLLGGLILALAWLIWNKAGKWRVFLSCVQICLLVFSLWATDSRRHLFASPTWLVNLEKGLTFLITGLAVIALARILGWVLVHPGPFSRSKLLLAGAASIPILLLIGVQAATASAWDVATDGLGGVLVLELNTVFAIAAAILLAWRLPVPRRSPAFIFAMLMAIFIAGANQLGTFGFDGAWGNVPRARTQRRAEVINQAILRYHERQGKYPPALSDLTPGYLLYLPPPFIMAGQDWCYQGEAGSYRLGYVYRDYFSTPASVKIHASAGDLPDLNWACEAEAAKYQMP